MYSCDGKLNFQHYYSTVIKPDNDMRMVCTPSFLILIKETPAVWTAASGLIVSRLCFQRALHRVRLHSSNCVFEQRSNNGRESFAPSQRNAIALSSDTTSHTRARVSLSSFIYKYQPQTAAPTQHGTLTGPLEGVEYQDFY